MSNGWDRFQELIKEQMRRVYSEKFIEHSMDPKNLGFLEKADTYVSVLGSCGDNMELWLKVDGEIITEATFMTDGCSATIACGSMLTELAKNRTLGEALTISAKKLIVELGGLPEDHVHCAGLASLTLKKAIIEYTKLKKEPWKKPYNEYDIRNNPFRVNELEAE